MNIDNRHEKELSRMYDLLETLEPGSDEHNTVLGEIMKARSAENELKKIENDRKAAKRGDAIKIGVAVVTAVVVPVIDLMMKRNLTKYIGTIEQMDTFTSTPSRGMASWFRFK